MDEKPEFKQVSNYEIKSEESGVFTAYVATRRVDRDGDQFSPGAFVPTIKDTKGKIPVLVGHDPGRMVGGTMHMSEDDKGLFVEGKMFLDTAVGRDAWAVLKNCAAMDFPIGFSVGFIAKSVDMDSSPGVRLINEVKLFEVSTTPWPAQYGTGVQSMKTYTVSESKPSAGADGKPQLATAADAGREFNSALRDMMRGL